jgi:hypothetical protein
MHLEKRRKNGPAAAWSSSVRAPITNNGFADCQLGTWKQGIRDAARSQVEMVPRLG